MANGREWLLRILVTAGLLLPAVTGLLLLNVDEAPGVNSLNLPECLEDWSGVDIPQDENTRKVWRGAKSVYRNYVNKDGTLVNVAVFQKSANDQLHPLTYCLIAHGGKPKLVGKVSLQTKNGQLNAALRRFHLGKRSAYSLCWYQWPGFSSPTEGGERWQRIILRCSGKKFLWREVQLVKVETDDPNADLQDLEDLAKLVFCVPF